MTARPVRLYLLDIEGTAAPLTLTSELLFPYARAHFAGFLRQHGGDADVLADLALLAEENSAETDPARPKFERDAPDPDSGTGETSALRYLFWLMDRDRKSTALKSLQGKIWKAGFESGELKGTLFADVPPALERWSKNAKVAIYSSGSVEAQRLLFSHTTVGDLTSMISGYFDTRTGPKMESMSYAAIAAAIGVAPAEILFFSDVVRELDAAREAGCRTRLVVRPGNPPVEDAHRHQTISSFD
ncbi:MAG TPA: acireductone synthase [Terracidiphilus sp.]|nr:acireductone synthase [Terracidiphilus sp.]